MGKRAPTPPKGQPRCGALGSTAGDVRWALDCARRFIFAGGDWSEIRTYVDRWLDYAIEQRFAGQLGRGDTYNVAR